MELEDRYTVCQKYFEDGAHLFFKCKKVKDIWRRLGLEKVRKELAELESPKQALERIMHLRENEKMHAIILLWMWWYERNKMREGEIASSLELTAYKVSKYGIEFQEVFGKDKQQSNQMKKRWSKPEIDELKINCDAAFNEETMAGGWGYVIRNTEGEVIQAARGRIDYVRDSSQAEMIACLQGVQGALDMGITRVVLETDALLVKQAINSEDYYQSNIGGLIRELKELVLLNFAQFQCVYVPRDCNRVAHALAALGRECVEGDYPVLDLIPLCILKLVADDNSAHE